MCVEGYKIEREMERTKRDHERENEERMSEQEQADEKQIGENVNKLSN